MPVVNGKEFPYTKKGMAAAKAEKSKPKDPYNGDKPAMLNKSKPSSGEYKDTPEGKESYKRFLAAKANPNNTTTDFMNGDWRTTPKKDMANTKAAAKGDSSKPDYMGKMAKMTALKRELASRKSKADASKKRRSGESEADYKKRVRTMTYGNPNE
jgi:hypothetical protein